MTNEWRGSSLEALFDRNSSYSHDIELRPSQHHAILFRLPFPSDHQAQPKPHRSAVSWNGDYVRLPSSEENKYFEINNCGVKITKVRWNLIQETLLQSINTSKEFENAVKTYNSQYAPIWEFSALHHLLDYENKQYSIDQISDFFTNLLPKIIRLALQLPDLIQCSIPLLKAGTNKSISMSQQQSACLLANAFLCTFPRRNSKRLNHEYSNYPEINFNRLFQWDHSKRQNVLEKLKCIFNYFKRVLVQPMPINIITIQRRTCESFNWEKSSVKFSDIKYHITSRTKIEDADGMIQVDFANKSIGGGVLGHGCVQEEIRFMMCPDMIIAMLVSECMSDRDALTITGCERFNDYKGYGDGFQFNGDFRDKTRSVKGRKLSRVVAIDALNYNNRFNDQFLKQHLTRDLNKAYTGFKKYNCNDRLAVATGAWGCGAFAGVPIRSALIQLMACAVNERNIMLTLVESDKAKEEKMKSSIDEIFRFIEDKEVTVGELYTQMSRLQDDDNFQNLIPAKFATYLKEKLISKDPKPIQRPIVLKQTSMFTYMPSKSDFAKPELPASKKTEDKSQPSTSKSSLCQSGSSVSPIHRDTTFNRDSSSSNSCNQNSRDKQRFTDIEYTFASISSQSKSHDEKKSKPSLIESLDVDMKESSKKKY